MKRILFILFLALCCACTKEKAVSVETLPSFLRSMKWTGCNVITNNKGEEVQRDSLTLYFVNDSLGMSRRHGYFNSAIPWKRHYDEGLNPFRYKATGDGTIELLTIEGRTFRLELDQPGRNLYGDWEDFPDLTGNDIQSEDRERVVKAHTYCGICGPELFWKNSGNILYVRGKGPMFDYSSQESVPWRNLGITAIFMDNGITNIGNWAFAKFALSNSIRIPDSVSRIGDYAFYSCSPLTLSFGKVSDLETIGEHAFEHSSLDSFPLKDKVKEVGDYAFHDIPNMYVSLYADCPLKRIGKYAFTGFENDVVYIPSTVETIGTHAFEGNFIEIHLLGIPAHMEKDAFLSYREKVYLLIPKATPPRIEGFPFDPADWNLRVPYGSKSLYQKTTPWNQFKNIYEYTDL